MPSVCVTSRIGSPVIGLWTTRRWPSFSESRLLAVGLDSEDDYSDLRWSVGNGNLYLVGD